MRPILVAVIVIIILVLIGAVAIWATSSSGDTGSPDGDFGPGDYIRRPDGTIGKIESDGTLSAYASASTYKAHGSPSFTDVSTDMFNSFPRGPNIQ